MMKMLIKLDEAGILRDGKDVKEMWNIIDSVFEECECTKVEQDDGHVLYEGNVDRDSSFSDLELIFDTLRNNSVIIKYATKWWLLYDEGKDESEYQYEDCLQAMQITKE